MSDPKKTPWIEDGHLGGYIPGGDPCTFCSKLWKQLLIAFNVESVLDIGCAEGHAMQWFLDNGCEVRGIEGCEQAIQNNPLRDLVTPHDFASGPITLPPVDLVWCCEVLEHIEEQYLPNLLAAMNCKIAVVTAAMPGQTGYHHVNCQLTSYWIKKFSEVGFTYDPLATQFYKNQGTGIGWWFYHNGFIFVRDEN